MRQKERENMRQDKNRWMDEGTQHLINRIKWIKSLNTNTSKLSSP